MLHAACSTTRSLPDAPADALSGQRTLAAMIGPLRAWYAALGLAVAAILVTPVCEPRMGVWSGVALGV
ncbi:hypothetical protein, partial [Oceanidesulfovibrio marinus]|uniref:hypothetical protein n=1 Tax=Oceanidesulfovibrio marinus TaxID=370038 RepID=UPI001ABEEF32